MIQQVSTATLARVDETPGEPAPCPQCGGACRTVVLLILPDGTVTEPGYFCAPCAYAWIVA